MVGHESLEPRVLLTSVSVINTNDSGPGSLRWAIDAANANADLSTISFSIPGAGTPTIEPSTPLPTVSTPVIIDATTQPGFDVDYLPIEISGQTAGWTDGLVFGPGSDGSVVRGVAINRFERSGVVISGANDVQVQGCFIGTDVTGSVQRGNGEHGVLVVNGSTRTIVGTNGDGSLDDIEGNVISGNQLEGVSLQGVSCTKISGNLIGVDASGSLPLGNGRIGIYLTGNSHHNIIGTDGNGRADEAERNVVSANGGEAGILFANSPDVHSNRISGNLIGTDKNGLLPIGNHGNGIMIRSGAYDNLVGTDCNGISDELERNIISGNNGGISLQEDNTRNNRIAGNIIGLNVTASGPLPNLGGILIYNGPSGNIIGSDPGEISNPIATNIISGNNWYGINLDSCESNTVNGNLIGLDGSGLFAISNEYCGIQMSEASYSSVDGNVISGNVLDGILVSESSEVTIQNNKVGTTANGMAALGNLRNGIAVQSSSFNCLVQSNLVSGNGVHGILLSAGANDNKIQSNIIGTDAGGNFAVPNHANGIRIFNSSFNTIGVERDPAPNSAQGNLISGNLFQAIAVFGSLSQAPSTDNIIAGNVVGLSSSGTGVIGGGNGIVTAAGSLRTQIGTDGNGIGDEIEGNRVAGVSLHGIAVSGVGNIENTIAGNVIGVDSGGNIVGVGSMGIRVFDGGSASIGVVPGSSQESGNRVAGARNFGIQVQNSSAGVVIKANEIFGSSVLQNYAIDIRASEDVSILQNAISGVHTIGVAVSNNSQSITIRENEMGPNTSRLIDLDLDGRDNNDLLDSDSGSNGKQNYPTIVKAAAGTTTQVMFQLDSVPNSTYTIDFYIQATDSVDRADWMRYADSIEITTDASGSAEALVTLLCQSLPGESLVATATAADNSTSEFSSPTEIQLKATLTGAVFVDVDGDRLYDADETGIDGVQVDLTNEAGDVLFSTVTRDGGMYLFEDLPAGVYRIREHQPTGVSDGPEVIGTEGGTIVSNDIIEVHIGLLDALNYNFTEVGSQLSPGDTAPSGFWQNKHGQQLIPQGGTALANWLTNTFPNVFGDALAGASGDDVAAFYKDTLFKQQGKKSATPPKVDAQFMAIAMSVFFTNRNLAGNVAESFGFTVTDTGIGTRVVNVGSSGLAFGVADNTDLTIMQILLATNGMTDVNDNRTGFTNVYDINGDGVVDASERAYRLLAQSIFDLILGGGSI